MPRFCHEVAPEVKTSLSQSNSDIRKNIVLLKLFLPLCLFHQSNLISTWTFFQIQINLAKIKKNKYFLGRLSYKRVISKSLKFIIRQPVLYPNPILLKDFFEMNAYIAFPNALCPCLSDRIIKLYWLMTLYFDAEWRRTTLKKVAVFSKQRKRVTYFADFCLKR